MRPPLNDIEFIENYILGNLDPEEQSLAQERINNSSDLTQLLETQQCIYSATRRKALRSEIQAYAPPRPNFLQRNRNWFIGGVGIIAFIGGLFMYSSTKATKKQHSDPSHVVTIHNEQSTEDVTPWIPFQTQSFSFLAEEGTTIVGNSGTLILLAKNSLRDANGALVKGEVEAELIEAIDWEDMIAYNLTTSSNGKALSSGGMFRIRYQQNGKEVFVDPAKPMHIEVPTNNFNPDMKIWEGEVENGELNWKNPQEIERHLTTIKLAYLDFLPAGFENEVGEMLPMNGHESLSTKLVDSLYYSISGQNELFSQTSDKLISFGRECYFDIPIRNDIERMGGKPFQSKPEMQGKNIIRGRIVTPEGEPIVGMDVKLRMDRYLEHRNTITTDENGYFTFDKLYTGEVAIYASLHSDPEEQILWKYCVESSFQCPKTPNKVYTLKQPFVADFSSVVNLDAISVQPRTGGCFIDPMKIKTLKTSRFQNTFIATTAFEARLRELHKMKAGNILIDIYVNNLSEPMWKCDQMIANQLSGQEKEIFEQFANERLTNVKNDDLHQEALTSYYSQQRKSFIRERRYQMKQRQDKTAEELRELRRSIDNTLNDPEALAAAHSRSKLESTPTTKIAHMSISRNTAGLGDNYTFRWASNAWCNIDSYLKSFGSRDWAIDVNRYENSVRVLQCIRETQSVLDISQPLSGGRTGWRPISTIGSAGVFCLAMLRDDDQLYFDSKVYSQSEGSTSQLSLTSVTNEEFYARLSSLAPMESFIATELQNEKVLIESQLKMKQRVQPYTRKLNTVKTTIESEIVMYNHLFDFLNQCADRRNS